MRGSAYLPAPNPTTGMSGVVEVAAIELPRTA
jgi:hypothetical protein